MVRRFAIPLCFAVLPALLAVLAFEGGGTRNPPPPPTGTDRNPVVFAPGRLVGIGGGRTLYVKCEGSGTPTVLLEAGRGGTSEDWDAVQGPLSRVTRTCSYDRAGLGNSLPSPAIHGAADEVADLGRLLGHAGLGPPYVLVGASYGELLSRLFAHAHARATVGLVLVDALVQDVGQALDAAVTTIGRLPQVLITRGGQPAVVVAAVVAVIDAARTHRRLPACSGLLRGGGVRCAAGPLG